MIVCTSACDCDPIGTADCIEDHDGTNVCVCHPKFTGLDCSECIDGYYRNADGFCERVSLCQRNGGEEMCNGHGRCEQEGNTAVCYCDHGFANDGLDQCGRCADPLMDYPSECHKSRNWVTSHEQYECESLMHEMPRKLFTNPNKPKKGGFDEEHKVVYQQKNGVLEWAGRYALINSDLSQRHSLAGHRF